MRKILAILIMSITTQAQMLDWPSDLSVPENSSIIDSSESRSGYIESSHSLLYNAYNSKNRLEFETNRENTSTYHYGNFFSSSDSSIGLSNYYADMGGQILRRSFPFDFITIGGEWFLSGQIKKLKGDRINPVDSTDQDYKYTVSSAFTTVSGGPILGFDIGSFPTELSAGGIVNNWNDSIS